MNALKNTTVQYMFPLILAMQQNDKTYSCRCLRSLLRNEIVAAVTAVVRKE